MSKWFLLCLNTFHDQIYHQGTFSGPSMAAYLDTVNLGLENNLSQTAASNNSEIM